MARLIELFAGPYKSGQTYKGLFQFGNVPVYLNDGTIFAGARENCFSPPVPTNSLYSNPGSGNWCAETTEIYMATRWAATQAAYLQVMYNELPLITIQMLASYETMGVWKRNNSGTSYTRYNDPRMLVTSNRYYCLEAYFKYGASGRVTVKLDSNIIFDQALDISPSGTTGFNRWSISSPYTWQSAGGFSWLAVNDSSGAADNSWITNLSFQARTLNSDVGPNEMNKYPDTGTHYEKINDLATATDLNATKLWTDDPEQETRHGLTAHTMTRGTPQAQIVHMLGVTDYSQKAVLGLGNGSSDLESAEQPLGIDTTLARARWTKDAADADWTFASMNEYDELFVKSGA